MSLNRKIHTHYLSLSLSPFHSVSIALDSILEEPIAVFKLKFHAICVYIFFFGTTFALSAIIIKMKSIFLHFPFSLEQLNYSTQVLHAISGHLAWQGSNKNQQRNQHYHQHHNDHQHCQTHRLIVIIYVRRGKKNSTENMKIVAALLQLQQQRQQQQR